MRLHEDGSAGGLVHAPGLHAHHPVFHDIHDADAVFAAQLVKFADDVGNFHLLAVDADGDALFKGHGHVLTLIRSLLRGYAQNQEMVVVGLAGRVFQFQSLMADVP